MRIALLCSSILFLTSCAFTTNIAPPSEIAADALQERLARELGIISLTTTASVLIRRGDTDAALAILERDLERSAHEAERYVKKGARLPAEFPHLLDAPRRAAEYARENQLPDLSKRLTALHDDLR
jgi:hypothetical protein